MSTIHLNYMKKEMRLRRLRHEHRHHYHRAYSLNVKSFANAVMLHKIYIDIRPLIHCIKEKEQELFHFTFR